MDDDALRSVITRLARPHPSGGNVIERAAVLAEGARSGALLAWIADHDGQPEALVPVAARGGLHSARLTSGHVADTSAPRRYVLPPGALS
jgi:hypothetical protein